MPMAQATWSLLIALCGLNVRWFRAPMIRMFGYKGDILDDEVEPFVCVFDVRDEDIPNFCDDSGQNDATHVVPELGLKS
jgi:hypothetical protein